MDGPLRGAISGEIPRFYLGGTSSAERRPVFLPLFTGEGSMRRRHFERLTLIDVCCGPPGTH